MDRLKQHKFQIQKNYQINGGVSQWGNIMEYYIMESLIILFYGIKKCSQYNIKAQKSKIHLYTVSCNSDSE